MLKLFFGFILFCFITYNFIIHYQSREDMLAETNNMTLQLIETLQKELQNNAANPRSN